MTQDKDVAAVALGRKGGMARAAALTDEQLAEIGKKGAEARWGTGKKKAKPRDGARRNGRDHRL